MPYDVITKTYGECGCRECLGFYSEEVKGSFGTEEEAEEVAENLNKENAYEELVKIRVRRTVPPPIEPRMKYYHQYHHDCMDNEYGCTGKCNPVCRADFVKLQQRNEELQSNFVRLLQTNEELQRCLARTNDNLLLIKEAVQDARR